MTGQILGNRYELGELLGQGGMAQVYRARDQVLDRPVAIKILRSEYTNDATLVARFQREAHAAANLVHPNIVAIYDIGQAGGQYYIVMEYIAGCTLKDVIRQRAPLTVDFSCKVAEQVCAALEYAHRHGVIHRDIKPQNILLSEDEEVVKVADFGIAKSRIDPETTADRMALGTVKYISPEQARGVEVAPQSDLYSLGVVLYEMLTGQQPFDGNTPVSIALQHAETAPLPPRQLNPYLPPAVEGIVLRVLSKDPRARFASAREMRQALERYRLAGVETTGPIPQPVLSVPGAAPPRVARPAGIPLVEPSGQVPYTTLPRRPARAASAAGLGPLGIVLLVLIAAGLVGLVVLGGQALPYLFPAGPTATPTVTPMPTAPPQKPVPDLKGLSPQEARTRLEQFGLQYAEGQPVFDPYIVPGQVANQEPAFGVYVPEGTAVTVRLGARPGLAQVPQVVQMSSAAAKLKLEEMGFRVQQKEVGCINTASGFVDRQEPRGGVEEIQGITVTVYVSIGDQGVMPDLLRVSLDEARRRIQVAGLVLRYENAQTQANMPPGVDINDKGGPGQVISYRIYHSGAFRTEQEVMAGQHVQCGATIDVAYYATTP